MATLGEQLTITSKACTGCHEVKPLDEFSPHRTGRFGRRPRCKACCSAYTAQYRKQNPDAVRAAAAKWRTENAERHRELTEAWKRANPERVRRHARTSRTRNSDRRRDYRMRKTYGISTEQYEEMVVRQNGRCAICENPPPEGKRLAVDHCHETGRVRDLLCEKCNRGIGHFSESVIRLERAISYVTRWSNLT